MIFVQNVYQDVSSYSQLSVYVNIGTNHCFLSVWSFTRFHGCSRRKWKRKMFQTRNAIKQIVLLLSFAF